MSLILVYASTRYISSGLAAKYFNIINLKTKKKFLNIEKNIDKSLETINSRYWEDDFVH